MSGDLLTPSGTCQWAEWQVHAATSDSEDAFSYWVPDYCWQVDDDSEDCFGPHSCNNVTDGQVLAPIKAVFRAPEGTPTPVKSNGTPGAPWIQVGWSCFYGSVITAEDVWNVVEQLPWSSPDLEVQPPGGRTLVNLPTNFYTNHVIPPPRTIDVKSRNVRVRVSEAEYSWRWDDARGSGGVVTTSPGRQVHDSEVVDGRLPDGTVWFQYLDAGVTVTPSVKVVYHVEYKIQGVRGDWVAIPHTISRDGESEDLAVVEARPSLVVR